MHKALHPRDDIDRLYVPRKGGRTEPASIEDSVNASIQWLEDIQKLGGRLITATRNNTDYTKTNRTITRKQKRGEKQLYKGFKWLIGNITREKT